MALLTFLKAILLPVGFAIAIYRLVLQLSPIQPLPLILPSPPAPTGPFSPNSLLHHIHKIGVGQLPQPEDVTFDRLGRLYVGCADGWIKRIHPSNWAIENWIHIDGRPLGLAMGLHDELIVCEPSRGLLNVTEERIEVLSSEADGVKFKLTDAVTVARDGSIYFTDGSHKYPFGTAALEMTEAGPYGRLLRYDPTTTRSTTTLMKDLYFANGVALSADESFLVFCETTVPRLQRYWLKGDKRGKSEIFLDKLPGFPDNVKNDGNGRFWIGLLFRRSVLVNLAYRYPFLRHLQVVLGLTEYFKDYKRALVLSVTEEGAPVSTFGDPNGASIQLVTTGCVVGDDLYLGSLGVDFLGHLKLNATI